MARISFLFLVASFALANGFYTQKCNHDVLEQKTMGMIQCLNKRWKAIEHLFKPNNMQNMEDNPLGCDFIDKNIECWNNHLGSCFIDGFKNDMATLLDASYENQAYVSCHRNGVRRTNQLTLVQQRLTQKYAKYKMYPQKLNEIIQLDNPCSSSSFESAVQTGMFCFMMKAQTQVEKFANAMQPSYSTGGLNSNVDLPFCEVLAIGLDCFKLKDCLSDQESEFMADLIVTLYKVGQFSLCVCLISMFFIFTLECYSTFFYFQLFRCS